MGVYYLSDTSFNAIAHRTLNDARLTVGAIIERGVLGKVSGGWLEGLKVDLPADIKQRIADRAVEVERRTNKSAIARGDKRRRTVAARELYDGVIYRVVFGALGKRRARQFEISGEVEKRLAQWLKSEGIVQRRAASQRTLAGCALELIGRAWVKGG